MAREPRTAQYEPLSPVVIPPAVSRAEALGENSVGLGVSPRRFCNSRSEMEVMEACDCGLARPRAVRGIKANGKI